MTTSIRLVPILERWGWAKLQARVAAEGGAPPQRWAKPDEAGSVLAAVGYLLYMLRWKPFTNGDAVIVVARSRFGKIVTLLVATAAIALIVGLVRRLPAAGVVAASVGFPWILGAVVHTMIVWPSHGRRHTHLANLVRRPGAARGTGVSLFRDVVDEAAVRGDTVTLRTTEPALADLYRSYGFQPVRDHGESGVLMARQPPDEPTRNPY